MRQRAVALERTVECDQEAFDKSWAYSAEHDNCIEVEHAIKILFHVGKEKKTTGFSGRSVCFSRREFLLKCNWFI